MVHDPLRPEAPHSTSSTIIESGRLRKISLAAVGHIREVIGDFDADCSGGFARPLIRIPTDDPVAGTNQTSRQRFAYETKPYKTDGTENRQVTIPN